MNVTLPGAPGRDEGGCIKAAPEDRSVVDLADVQLWVAGPLNLALPIGAFVLMRADFQAVVFDERILTPVVTPPQEGLALSQRCPLAQGSGPDLAVR